jgi:plastocyanin
MMTRLPLMIAAIALLGVVVACGGSDPNVSPAATDAVAMRGDAFAPAHVEVRIGSSVTWTNEDDAQRDVVFDDGVERSELLAAGESYQRTFNSAGTFDYVCSLHRNMRGRVTVRS